MVFHEGTITLLRGQKMEGRLGVDINYLNAYKVDLFSWE
jgi:hypothetical protein